MRDKRLNLKSEVLQNAERFEFFEAARLLRIIASRSRERPKEGWQVRFRSAATKSFPPGEIQKLEQTEKGIELFTYVIGLFGPTGVLPHQDKDLFCGV